MADEVIRVDGLSHRFDELVAVDGVSFSVSAGEVFSFLGPNGAGKSTVINVLTTLLPMQDGEVVIAGRDLRTDPLGVREAIGIVFQEVTLDRDMTVGETLEFHGRLYGLPREERRARTDELVALVELEAKRDTLIKHLSGGMKRRLEIARALSLDPKLLLLDEPAAGMNPEEVYALNDLITAIHRDFGLSIIVIEHHMDLVMEICPHIVCMNFGAKIAEGGPEAIQRHPEVLKAYLGDEEETA